MATFTPLISSVPVPPMSRQSYSTHKELIKYTGSFCSLLEIFVRPVSGSSTLRRILPHRLHLLDKIFSPLRGKPASLLPLCLPLCLPMLLNSLDSVFKARERHAIVGINLASHSRLTDYVRLSRLTWTATGYTLRVLRDFRATPRRGVLPRQRDKDS